MIIHTINMTMESFTATCGDDSGGIAIDSDARCVSAATIECGDTAVPGQRWRHIESGKIVAVESVGDFVTIKGIHWPYWLVDAFLDRFEFVG
ncbi:MAG: hypothetical protein AAF702_44615 [Chloroflexota bacterium]